MLDNVYYNITIMLSVAFSAGHEYLEFVLTPEDKKFKRT